MVGGVVTEVSPCLMDTKMQLSIKYPGPRIPKWPGAAPKARDPKWHQQVPSTPPPGRDHSQPSSARPSPAPHKQHVLQKRGFGSYLLND